MSMHYHLPSFVDLILSSLFIVLWSSPSNSWFSVSPSPLTPSAIRSPGTQHNVLRTCNGLVLSSLFTLFTSNRPSMLLVSSQPPLIYCLLFVSSSVILPPPVLLFQAFPRFIDLCLSDPATCSVCVCLSPSSPRREVRDHHPQCDHYRRRYDAVAHEVVTRFMRRCSDAQ